MSFVLGIFVITDSNYEMFQTCIVVYALSLVGFVTTRGFLTKVTSHWIQDRLNERIWAEDNQLFHFLQTPFAAGLNIYNADETAILFCMDISSIRNARYDEKSKRIEFIANGHGCHYSDYRKNIIDKQWNLNGFEAIFYDCSEPSLFNYLKEQGVQFEVGTIEYKLSNQI